MDSDHDSGDGQRRVRTGVNLAPPLGAPESGPVAGRLMVAHFFSGSGGKSGGFSGIAGAVCPVALGQQDAAQGRR